MGFIDNYKNSDRISKIWLFGSLSVGLIGAAMAFYIMPFVN